MCHFCKSTNIIEEVELYNIVYQQSEQESHGGIINIFNAEAFV